MYISIFLIGFVFTILSLLTEQPLEVTTTILYITCALILFIKLIEEWQYYRSYNAPLASAIFIVFPSLIALGGSFIANFASIGEENFLRDALININLDLEILNIGSFYLYINIFGLIFSLPCFIIILVLLRRYYSGRYPSIFIFRKRFSSDILLLYNCTMLLILGYFWIENRIVELTGLSFIIMSYIFFTQYYLLDVILVPIRRMYSNSRSHHASNSTSNSYTPPIISWEEASASSSRSRSRPSSRPSSRVTSSNRGSVQVVPAVNTPKTRTVNKLSPAVIFSLTPVGRHVTNDDFRCIFCYEFPTESNKRVVICPHCKHPAHANELQKWLAVANICSRCNKPIANVKMVRLTGTNYKKIIRMFQKE
ncbi:MAG: hypothetical protein ACW97X_01005 [Candidatus Hodarchaeales archaeon]